MGRILTIEETAELIHMPAHTLRYWLGQRRGPLSFKVGRRRMFREEDVKAWLDEQYQKARTEAAEEASA